jgi:hypothetical protein
MRRGAEPLHLAANSDLSPYIRVKGYRMFTGVRAPPPSHRHLRHWERVCCFLDAQSYRSVRFPYPSDPPITTRLLKRMATHRLVRHRDDCRWQLAPRWSAILRTLWAGSEEEGAAQSETSQQDAEGAANGPPFVTDWGVDTLYANLLSADGLPARLIAACEQLKARAQEADATAETPWLVLGAPLSIHKAGKGTDGRGRGVSWSYILRNALVMVVLRKTPLSGLLGSVRLSSECLWTHGPRAALDAVRADLRRMWTWGGAGGTGSFKAVRWQLSQIHLCTDVARWSPQPADLERVVTRSLRRAVHFPSAADVDAAALAVAPEGEGLAGAPWLDMLPPPEWASLPVTLDDGMWDMWGDQEQGEAEGSEPPEEEAVDVADNLGAEDPADERGASAHLWGRRASGFAVSPGAALSAVWYDKLLEERLSGKRWMEPVHRAGGWLSGMALTRVEVRFRRDVLRELAWAFGQGEGERGQRERWFDDPWTCLDHLADLWAYFAGLPPEHDHAPDVTHRGWMRLTVPDAHDGNRSRWKTDPTWMVIQRAFAGTAGATPAPLARFPKTSNDLEQVDAELYGLLKLRTALRGEYLTTTATLSQELHAFAERMDEVDAERGRDYAEEVREKARMLGKPLPMRDESNTL